MKRLLVSLLAVSLIGTASAKSSSPPKHLKFGSVPGNLPPLSHCTGACVSFSSQGEAAILALTGKKLSNFQAIEAIACADRPMTITGGQILQMANAIGIQTIQGSVGSAIVRGKVSTNWRAITTNVFKYGTMIALGVMTSGAFGAVSKGVLLTTAIAHESADDLPNLIASGSPNPDPFLNNILNASAALGVSPTNCQDVLFPGVYEGPGTSFVTVPIQLIP